jgi:hypothetical protein
MKVCQYTLKPKDFELLFGESLSQRVKNRIKKYDLRYTDVSPKERNLCLKQIFLALKDQSLVYSGEHRYKQWVKGWNENLNRLKAGAKDAIIPGYFGKYRINRLRQKFIKSVSKDFEYNMLGVILDWLFDRYFRRFKNVYEFGCGTGHNLIRLRSFNPKANLYGLDWAESSQILINKYARIKGDDKLFAKRFNYFKPDFNFKLEPGSAIYTVASLEQVGKRYRHFVDYLLKNKPAICLHVEPITELLNRDNLMDYLSICYFKKRKYLCGFLTYLKELASGGKLKIIKAKRNYIGSFFIEGYSVIIWTPKV